MEIRTKGERKSVPDAWRIHPTTPILTILSTSAGVEAGIVMVLTSVLYTPKWVTSRLGCCKSLTSKQPGVGGGGGGDSGGGGGGGGRACGRTGPAKRGVGGVMMATLAATLSCMSVSLSKISVLLIKTSIKVKHMMLLCIVCSL